MRRRKSEKIIDKLLLMYWTIIPYDYRLNQLWYRFTCWAWKRYTTVKCRYLPHTWQDRSELLPHTMFEILSRFIEEECSPGPIEWYGDFAHKITVNGREKYVRDEMQDIYDWWHSSQTLYEDVSDILWEEAKKHRPTDDFIPINHNNERVDEDNAEAYLWEEEFKNEKDKEIYNLCMRAMSKVENEYERSINEMCHRLINIRQYLWT